jgi:hypothetical protein
MRKILFSFLSVWGGGRGENKDWGAEDGMGGERGYGRGGGGGWVVVGSVWEAVLLIHDIWCGSGSGSADPCIRLIDPDPRIHASD